MTTMSKTAWTTTSKSAVSPYGDDTVFRPGDRAPAVTKAEYRESTSLSGQWNRFGDGVSIAGVKYISDASAHPLRRLLWLALVLGSLGFMVYQIQERVVYFMGFPTTVDVRVNYNNSLHFPTVTICNENSVRRVAAAYYRT